MKVHKGTGRRGCWIRMQKEGTDRGHFSNSSTPFVLFIYAPATFFTEPTQTSWQGKVVNTEEKSGQWLGATVISTSRPSHYGKLLVSSVWLKQKSCATKLVRKRTSYDFYALFYFFVSPLPTRPQFSSKTPVLFVNLDIPQLNFGNFF